MRKQDRRTGIALLLCLMLSLQMCLPPASVLAETAIDYTAEGYSGTYDGQLHSITVNVTTPDVSVFYYDSEKKEYSSQQPSFTDVGTYTVKFMLQGDGYTPVEDSATVTITEGTIPYNVEGFYGPYDGKSHSITVIPPADATVTYATTADGLYGSDNPSFSAVGEYTVYFKIEKANYTTVNSSATVKIDNKINYDVEGFDVEYDGEPHSISLDIRTEGVKVTYATSEDGPYREKNPEFIAIGQYTVFYMLEKSGYYTEEGAVTVEIKPIDISSEIEAALPSVFTWTGKPVQFNPPTDKIKEWSIVYRLGDGYLDSAPSGVDDQ